MDTLSNRAQMLPEAVVAAKAIPYDRAWGAKVSSSVDWASGSKSTVAQASHIGASKIKPAESGNSKMQIQTSHSLYFRIKACLTGS
jgi:hypothetical protein